MKFSIEILQSGEHAVSFKGHAGGILGLSIIERGRNILSCARDGVVKLWDVATQTCTQTFHSALLDNQDNKALNDVVCVPFQDTSKSQQKQGYYLF